MNKRVFDVCRGGRISVFAKLMDLDLTKFTVKSKFDGGFMPERVLSINCRP